LKSSPDIVRAITSKTMRWEGHVARVGEMRDHLGDLGVNGFWGRRL